MKHDLSRGQSEIESTDEQLHLPIPTKDTQPRRRDNNT